LDTNPIIISKKYVTVISYGVRNSARERVR